MTIGTPLNATGSAIGDDVSISSPQITVTAGSLVIMAVGRYSSTNDAMTLGDISSSGTATLTSWVLDRGDNANTGGVYANTALYSALVTGGGTLTATVSGHPSGSYIICGITEVPGTWDANRFEASNAGSASSASPTVSTNSAASAGPAFFIGVCQLNTSTSSITEDTNFTSIYKNVAIDTGAISYRIVSGATTDSCDWTPANNVVYGATLGVYREASSGYTLTADQGSYSLTGQATGALYARIFAANQGSYALTGQDITLSYNAARTITAEYGLYTVIGSDALVDHSMNAVYGSYTLTGQNVTLTFGALTNYSISADQGTYNLTGQTANMLFGSKVVSAQGSYTLTGRQVGLSWSGAPVSTGGPAYRINISRLHIGL
jgi:hypothetical protein